MAVLHFLDPAEIEEVLGDRGPERASDVRATLGPIEAESAKVAAGPTPRGKRDPELVKKTGARDRDCRGFVAEHNISAGNQRIGEMNAEAARKVIVADSGSTDRACLTGYRREPWPLLKSDGDDPFDHLRHFRRGKPEIPMSPIAVQQKQARHCQLREMCAGGLGSDSRC